MTNLNEQIALVTGASRGIGREIATVLAGAGATVIGTATSAGGAEAISDYLGANGQGIVLDVTDEPAVNAAVKNIAADKGAVTILVNNAGVTRDNLLLRMKPEEWDEIIDTNLTAIYRTSRACLRGMMKARHGRIINIGSVVAMMGNPGQANYAAAKAGMIGFTRALAREVASRNITVNTIAPGFIETDMTAAMTEGQRGEMAAQIPLGRLGQPADIAAAVRFLAGDGGYITGETLNINGGMYMA